jgi:hypothetical protein
MFGPWYTGTSEARYCSDPYLWLLVNVDLVLVWLCALTWDYVVCVDVGPDISLDS